MPVDYQSPTERFKIPAAVGDHVYFRESHAYLLKPRSSQQELS